MTRAKAFALLRSVFCCSLSMFVSSVCLLVCPCHFSAVLSAVLSVSFSNLLFMRGRTFAIAGVILYFLVSTGEELSKNEEFMKAWEEAMADMEEDAAEL